MGNDLKAKKPYITIDGYRVEDKFSGLDDGIKIEMLRKMYQIRHFENETEQFIIRGMIHGTWQLYTG